MRSLLLIGFIVERSKVWFTLANYYLIDYTYMYVASMIAVSAGHGVTYSDYILYYDLEPRNFYYYYIIFKIRNL